MRRYIIPNSKQRSKGVHLAQSIDINTLWRIYIISNCRVCGNISSLSVSENISSRYATYRQKSPQEILQILGVIVFLTILFNIQASEKCAQRKQQHGSESDGSVYKGTCHNCRITNIKSGIYDHPIQEISGIQH